MAFDTPNGTRGDRQPGLNRFERWANRWMIRHVASTGTLGRSNLLVLVTTGRVIRLTPR